MQTKGHKGHGHTLTWASVLPALFVVALATLIVLARSLPKPGDGEFRSILQGAREDRAKRARAVEQALKDLPRDAAIGADWNYRSILKDFDGGRLDTLMCLVGNYVNGTDGISADGEEAIRAALAEGRIVPDGSPFYFPFTLEDAASGKLRARLGRFLRQCKPLKEFEAAQALGMLQGIADTYHSPLESNLVKITVLLACRASFELADGDAPSALETLLSGYAIAGLFGDWPHCQTPGNRYYADRTLDRVLWRFVDTGPVSAADQERILQTLDARKPVDSLAKNLLIYAARLETGEETDSLGNTEVTRMASALTGRGALASVRQLVSLLAAPPCKVREQLEDIGRHRAAGYKVNQFMDCAIRGYRLHAREAMMGDMARLAFALKEWHRQHGAYPDSLDALQPFPVAGSPMEPLTGDPIRYGSDKDSFRLEGSAADTFWEEQYWVARR